jgi:toxin ParE1/3/4
VKLRFTPRAVRDLREIAEYIKADNPPAAERVRAALLSSVQAIAAFPHIGRRQSTGGVRKLVTGRHGYVVYYTVDERNDEVAVLTIQHPARERPWSDQ